MMIIFEVLRCSRRLGQLHERGNPVGTAGIWDRSILRDTSYVDSILGVVPAMAISDTQFGGTCQV